MLSWLDRYMAGHKGFIAGGCFKNIFSGQKVKDLDVFFEKQKDFDEADKTFSGDENYYFCYENKNAKAFKNKNTGIVVELIQKTFGTPEKILNDFDFTITKFAYFKAKDEDGNIHYKAMYTDTFFEHLHLKRLVLDDKILFPMGTFERMFRYTKYGYFPCRESKLKIISRIRELTDEEVSVSDNLYEGMD